MKVYVVCRGGVEWNDILEGYFDKHQADKAADALEKERLKSKDIHETLSQYYVYPLVMKDKR